MKRLMIVVSLLVVFFSSIHFSAPQQVTALAAYNCGNVIAGHLPGGEAPSSFCEDGKPLLDTHITEIEKAGKPCPIDAIVLVGGYESQAQFAQPVTEAASTCGPLIAGHTADGSSPAILCEDGKPVLDTHITDYSKAGKPCPVELCAGVLLGGRQWESTIDGGPEQAASTCGPLVGGHDSGLYPTEQCPIDGNPLLDQHITDYKEAGKPCPVQFCGAVITGGRLRQH